MGREIEFRCWNEHGKCFHGMSELSDKLHLFNNKNPSYVIEQFTGLLDCNGVKIFDGDIVKMWYAPRSTAKCLVSFSNGSFFLEVINATPKSCLIGDVEKNGNSLTVIGNIHQNSELLA
jgi:uncharacterized phage protein (TIGR01671 family)